MDMQKLNSQRFCSVLLHFQFFLLFRPQLLRSLVAWVLCGSHCSSRSYYLVFQIKRYSNYVISMFKTQLIHLRLKAVSIYSSIFVYFFEQMMAFGSQSTFPEIWFLSFIFKKISQIYSIFSSRGAPWHIHNYDYAQSYPPRCPGLQRC